MRQIFLGFFALALSLGIAACNKTPEQPPSAAPPATSSSPTAPLTPTPATEAAPSQALGSSADLTTDTAGLSKATAVLKTQKGSIKFKFYTKDAPLNVGRVAELVHRKYYNGLVFHRIVPGFVVQTGDAKTRIRGDAASGEGIVGNTVKRELNGRRHVRGTVGMARAEAPDSADTQFYITLGAFPHLDDKYTAIGQVVDYGEKSGEKDVLDRLSQGDEIIELRFE
jgi:cyclophilin family peptidyl-prolyl cis-trans isomerase